MYRCVCDMHTDKRMHTYVHTCLQTCMHDVMQNCWQRQPGGHSSPQKRSKSDAAHAQGPADERPPFSPKIDRDKPVTSPKIEWSRRSPSPGSWVTAFDGAGEAGGARYGSGARGGRGGGARLSRHRPWQTDAAGIEAHAIEGRDSGRGLVPSEREVPGTWHGRHAKDRNLHASVHARGGDAEAHRAACDAAGSDRERGQALVASTAGSSSDKALEEPQPELPRHDDMKQVVQAQQDELSRLRMEVQRSEVGGARRACARSPSIPRSCLFPPCFPACLPACLSPSPPLAPTYASTHYRRAQ